MTPRIQRIIIFVIAIIMVVGTIGSFLTMIFASKNAKIDQDRALEEYQVQQERIEAESKELSEKYFDKFNGFASRVAPFDPEAVGEEVKTEDLVIGDGDEIKEDASYRAYYIGWNPNGKIFDSSIKDGALQPPIEVKPGMGLIEGWMKGVAGMKINGVREITIPSGLAYGDKDQGADIPPNTPLKFIIMVIPPSVANG